jgi:uncharacterized membrane protein
MAADRDHEVQQQINELSARISSLEAAIAAIQTSQVTPRPENVPPSPAQPPRTPNTAASLESRIGGQLLNRAGILAVLVGTAWFLKLAIDRNWIGPALRIWIGLAAAAALIGGSERFRRQGFPAFAYSLKALGTGIAYLSLWAAANLYHLAPLNLVFVAMMVVTGLNAWLATRQSSEVLALYALAGGLATPVLLTMGTRELFLFSYLALLNAGALLLLRRHSWKRLAWAALLGTALYSLGWSWQDRGTSHITIPAFFIGLFFLAFAGLPWLQPEVPPVAFPIVNAAGAWLACLALFSARQNHGYRSWITFALAAASLAFAAAGRRLRAFAQTHFALGVFFVTVAMPFALHGASLRSAWLAESLLLVVMFHFAGGRTLKACAEAVLTLAAIALVVDWLFASPPPMAVLRNGRFATNLFAASIFAATALLTEKGRGYLAALSSAAFSLTALVTVCLEIHHYWFCGAGFFHDLCGAYGRLESRTIAAGWGYSAWCMVYGAALMTAGFLRRSALLRWQALLVLALSIARVFLNGVSQQSQLWRVFSFFALGILLLAISFAYQKDWLRLRG